MQLPHVFVHSPAGVRLLLQEIDRPDEELVRELSDDLQGLLAELERAKAVEAAAARGSSAAAEARQQVNKIWKRINRVLAELGSLQY
jgi:hypothetical protein